ncbi:MAG: serine/threonine protein kinase [Planctomycetes bacterium]|nr:serine/threonine protein kinase [Planctomycetota bacterium]
MASGSTHLRVPGYHSLRLLAGGGMATVYQAVQDRPQRPVALKVLRRGLSENSARRFQFETEVLARLQHPGIARIYEAGTCEDLDGQTYPFFAMEMVEGARPIAEYCRQNNLSVRQTLALFLEVCDAVQYGHQFGVIHRDLKSGNILVDASGRAKVIDFGIARSADRGEEGLTAEMDSGAILGTLNTMSPEQCSGAQDLDIRTDVYSLGVVLYQLLTGRFPHDLSRATVPEAIRIINHDEPVRPSALKPETRGDLDAILNKALDKDRVRRYASAGELAADIRRHLDFRPIEAAPATTLYHARKFAARNKGLTAAISVAAAALLVAVSVAVYAAQHARRSRDEAVAREKELESLLAFQEAQLSRIDVRKMGEGMRRNLETALASSGKAAEAPPARLDSVNFTDLARQTLDENILEQTRRAIHSQFEKDPLVRARLLQRLAGTMNTLGLMKQAEPVLREALAIRRERLGPDHEDTLLTTHSLGSLLTSLGQLDDAVEMLRETCQRRKDVLGPDHPATLRTASSLGGALRQRGDLPEAEVVWTQTLAAQRRTLGPDHVDSLRTLNNIGVVYAAAGKLLQAEAAWRELLERREKLYGPDSPEYLSPLSNLGLILLDQGKVQEARTMIERSLASERRQLGSTHPTTLATMSNLAEALKGSGELEAAHAMQQACINGYAATLGPEHPSTLRARGAYAVILVAENQASQAEPMFRAIYEAQVRALGPRNAETIGTLSEWSMALLAQGKAQDAADLGAKALNSAIQMLPPGDGTIGHYRSRLGAALAASGDIPGATRECESGYRILLAALGPDHVQTKTAKARLEGLSNDKAGPSDGQ